MTTGLRKSFILSLAMILFVALSVPAMAATTASLSKLVVSKNQLTLEIGETATVTATGVYADGTSSNLTLNANWSSDDASIASVYNGTITAKKEGTAVILVDHSNISQAVQVTVTKKVKALTKNVQSLDLLIGESESIELTATYNDNSTAQVSDKAEWSSNNSNVATVVNGVVKGQSSGTAIITAAYGKQTVTVEVNVEIVKRLEADVKQVSLLMKDTKKVALTATYPDGTTKDVTAMAAWESSDEAVADVINGEIRAYAAGTAELKASYGSKSVTIKVEVDQTRKLDVGKQEVFLHVGQEEQLTLNAVYPDGTSVDVTQQATWSTSNKSVAYVHKGKVSAESSGAAIITAKYGDKSITIDVDVDIPRYLDLSAEEVTLKVGEEQKLTLIATYANNTTEDVTSKAKWSSNKASIVYVSGGTIKAYKSGEATITASYGGESVTAEVKIDVPSKVALNTKLLNIKAKEETQVNLIASYSDGREEIVTDKAEWSVSKEAIAEVNKGLIKGLETGSATVTAQYNGTKYTLTVNVGLVENLEADARLIVLSVGETKNIALTATDAAGNQEDVTAEAVWKSSNINNVDVNKGVVKGFKSGKSTVTAEYGGKKVSIAVEVDVVTKIEANADFLSMKSGETETVTVTVTFSDGSTKDVTSDAEWKTGSYKIASVKDGKVSAVGYGKTNITAKYAGKFVRIPVDVDQLKYLQTDEVKLTLKKGDVFQLTATATYKDGSEVDVSKKAVWSSSKILAATVKDGQVKATGKGKATITVNFGGKKSKVIVVVE